MMNSKPKILVVDDDPDIIELLQYNLEKEGYVVSSASDGKKALEIAPHFLPDLVILDVMMPNLDGIETGKRLKKMSELKTCHLLYLTARSEEYTEIAAFEVGADDYIVKPIKPNALMSRINAFFRKEISRVETTNILEIAGLHINRANYVITKSTGELIILPKKEFEVLFFLAQKPNQVFSRTELLEKIWGHDVFVVERTVDVHIRKIREKIGENYIKTLKGVGYLFDCPA